MVGAAENTTEEMYTSEENRGVVYSVDLSTVIPFVRSKNFAGSIQSIGGPVSADLTAVMSLQSNMVLVAPILGASQD